MLSCPFHGGVWYQVAVLLIEDVDETTRFAGSALALLAIDLNKEVSSDQGILPSSPSGYEGGPIPTPAPVCDCDLVPKRFLIKVVPGDMMIVIEMALDAYGAYCIRNLRSCSAWLPRPASPQRTYPQEIHTFDPFYVHKPIQKPPKPRFQTKIGWLFSHLFMPIGVLTSLFQRDLPWAKMLQT